MGKEERREGGLEGLGRNLISMAQLCDLYTLKIAYYLSIISLRDRFCHLFVLVTLDVLY